MTAALAAGLLAAMDASSAVAGGAYELDVQLFRTSTGAEFPLPPVESLDCAGLDTVLSTISQTNYRDIGPFRPEHPDDAALYDYEHAAAAKRFEECLQKPTYGAIRISLN